MRVRLNKRTIDDAVYQGSGSCFLWDTQMPAFGIRIYPTGRKSYVVNYWSQGRRRFYTLGPVDKLTLTQAREEALDVFLQVRRGEDPADDRQDKRQAPTVGDLADRHIHEHSRLKNKPKSVQRERRAWDRCVLPKLGRRRVQDITRGDVARLMADLANTPAMANKVLTLLSKAFNLAEVWGWRPEGTNPCRHVGRYKDQARERFLSESELQRLGDVLAEAEQTWDVAPQAIAAVRLLLLTGCRSAEILTLRWDDVDFERRCLHLRDSKTGQRTVPLNDAAVRVLEHVERVDGNRYVVPGLKPGTHRSTLQPLWERIRQAADLDDVRIHDLRHTYASIGIASGHSLALIGKLLGHTKILTTQRYAHLADQPVRQASERIGATLEAALVSRLDSASAVPVPPVSTAERSGSPT